MNMPVLGIDFQRSKEEIIKYQFPIKEEPVKTSEIKLVSAYYIQPSTILPEREKSQEVIDSVRKEGQQQPIIVRPHPQKLGHFGLIDGNSRRLAIIGEHKYIRLFNEETAPDILCDIRSGLTESEVFRLYYNTEKKKKPAKAFERAVFYHEWIKTKANELGTQNGAKTEVAKALVEIETSLSFQENPQLFKMELNAKQSLLSQYGKVYEVITALEKEHPNHDFDYLKTLSVNKLYALSKRLDNMLVLKKVVDKIEKNPKMKLDHIDDLLNRDQRVVDNVPTYAFNVSITEEVGKNLHKKIYEKNRDIFYTSKSTKNIMADFVRQLLELYLIYPDKYVIELEKTKKENKLKAIWHTNA